MYMSGSFPIQYERKKQLLIGRKLAAVSQFGNHLQALAIELKQLSRSLGLE